MTMNPLTGSLRKVYMEPRPKETWTLRISSMWVVTLERELLLLAQEAG